VVQNQGKYGRKKGSPRKAAKVVVLKKKNSCAANVHSHDSGRESEGYETAVKRGFNWTEGGPCGLCAGQGLNSRVRVGGAISGERSEEDATRRQPSAR